MMASGLIDLQKAKAFINDSNAIMIL